MKESAGSTSLSAAGIVVAATVVGLVVNAVRADGRLEIGRSYVVERDPGGGRTAAEFAALDVGAAHELFEEGVELPGYVVFVDARGADLFEGGHIPGARRLDLLTGPAGVAELLPELQAAHKVVVYCGSVDCDDALLLCRELRDTWGVAAAKLHLFERGLAGWRERGLPVERG